MDAGTPAVRNPPPRFETAAVTEDATSTFAERSEVVSMFREREVPIGYFWCRCLDPTISAQYGSFDSHYLQGHYDIPVYKYIWEENGKIIESLSNPEDES